MHKRFLVNTAYFTFFSKHVGNEPPIALYSNQDNLITRNAYIARCPANLGNALPYCDSGQQYCVNIDDSMAYPDTSFCSYGVGQCPTCDANGMLQVPLGYHANCNQPNTIPACNGTIPGCLNTSTNEFSNYTGECLLGL